MDRSIQAPIEEKPWLVLDRLPDGLHSLDFSAFYNSRPAWDIVMLVLLVGGLISSFLGLYLGIGRVRRGTTRAVTGLTGGARQPEPAE